MDKIEVVDFLEIARPFIEELMQEVKTEEEAERKMIEKEQKRRYIKLVK